MGPWLSRPLESTNPRFAANDVVVFVVGPAGSGKSTFVNQVTRSKFMKVDSSLSHYTTAVHATKCELTAEAKAALNLGKKHKNIVFVDTPPFDIDAQAAKEMEDWLKKLKCKMSVLRIIYTHRIETRPSSTASVQDYLNSFVNPFPSKLTTLPRRVHAILNHYEGNLAASTIAERRTQFQAQLGQLGPNTWNPSLHSGLLRAESTETAWQAVKELFGVPSPVGAP